MFFQVSLLNANAFKRFVTSVMIANWVFSVASGADADYRWWPIQKQPKAIVRTSMTMLKEGEFSPEHMMIRSVAGLAAQAVNDNKCDELVWVDFDDSGSHAESYRLWYQVRSNVSMLKTAAL
jgi:hypothetical protein